MSELPTFELREFSVVIPREECAILGSLRSSKGGIPANGGGKHQQGNPPTNGDVIINKDNGSSEDSRGSTKQPTSGDPDNGSSENSRDSNEQPTDGTENSNDGSEHSTDGVVNGHSDGSAANEHVSGSSSNEHHIGGDPEVSNSSKSFSTLSEYEVERLLSCVSRYFAIEADGAKRISWSYVAHIYHGGRVDKTTKKALERRYNYLKTKVAYESAVERAEMGLYDTYPLTEANEKKRVEEMKQLRLIQLRINVRVALKREKRLDLQLKRDLELEAEPKEVVAKKSKKTQKSKTFVVSSDSE